MHKLIAVLLALTMFVAAACGDDDGGDDVAVDETTTTSTTEAESEFSTSPFEGEEAEIASAYERFFASETPPEEAAALMEATEVTEAVVSAAGAASEGGTSVEVTGVAIGDDDDIAEVQFTVKTENFGDIPFAGIAVNQDGAWKVSVHTLCSLLEFAGPPPECERVTNGEVGRQPPS
jgi:hypothetical protein